MVTTRNHGRQQNHQEGHSATALAEMKRELDMMRKQHEKDLARQARALEMLREENERLR